MSLKHKIKDGLWWLGIRFKFIERFLCWKGWHNWDFHYIFDKKDRLAKYGHIHIVGGWRKCLQKDCKTRQFMARQISGDNKIRWEK